MSYVKEKDGFLHLDKLVDDKSAAKITLMEAMKQDAPVGPTQTAKWKKTILKEIVEYSMNAATACNEQKWVFIDIDDKIILNELNLRGSAAFLSKANQALLVLYDNTTINKKFADHMQSGASFITNFMLIAHSKGIGSCWVCHLPRKRELKKDVWNSSSS